MPHTNAGVDHDATVGVGDHGVQVELCDRRQVLSEPCEPVDDLDERLHIGRRRTPEAAHEPPRLSAEDELLGVVVGQRRDPEPGLSDQLGEDAAGPERDERTEDRVLNDAGEELGASLDHRLDEDRRADAGDRRANRVLVGEVEGEPADLGLVRSGGGGLDDDREPQLTVQTATASSTLPAIRSGTSGRP